MQKLNGIKSVDFKIIASGEGVVNWNGAIDVAIDGSSGKTRSNHTIPKLRGYTNLTGESSEKGFKFKKEASDIDYSNTPLYISQNCIKHYLFKGMILNPQDIKTDSAAKTQLQSLYGLVRGYVNTIKGTGSLKRKSALRLGDLVDQLGNGNFEQLARSGRKDVAIKGKKADTVSDAVDASGDTSFFSKITFGQTRYIGYGSICIEDLQFISLDNIFDRKAVGVTSEEDGITLAALITEYLKTLNGAVNPVAIYHKQYVRSANIMNEAEEGILLNDDAISVLVEATLSLIKDLYITVSQGYVGVDSVLVDYNSGKPMRIKNDEQLIQTSKAMNYISYYTAI